MQAPSPREIRLALERLLYDVLSPEGVRLSAKNKKFDHKKATLWARATTRLGSPKTMEKGAGKALGTRPGVFIVQLFLLPEQDIGICEELCSKIETAFRLISLGNVFCEEPATVEVGLDKEDAWYQFNVIIPFWTWVGE